MDNELVSIITPMYKGELYVAETIESVINQTYKNWEHIIIDDCSPDNGAGIKVVENYANNDSRIKLIKLSENKGSSGARNSGLKLAKGRYICLLDSDDFWEDNFLESQLAFLKRKSASFVYSSYNRIDSQGNIILSPAKVRAKINYNDLLKTCDIGCLTVMYDSKEIGIQYLNEDLGSLRDDYELWLRIVKKVDLAYGNPEVLASYRILDSSASRSKLKVISPQFKIYYRVERLGLVRSLWYLLHWAYYGYLRYKR